MVVIVQEHVISQHGFHDVVDIVHGVTVAVGVEHVSVGLVGRQQRDMRLLVVP